MHNGLRYNIELKKTPLPLIFYVDGGGLPSNKQLYKIFPILIAPPL